MGLPRLIKANNTTGLNAGSSGRQPLSDCQVQWRANTDAGGSGGSKMGRGQFGSQLEQTFKQSGNECLHMHLKFSQCACLHAHGRMCQ